MRLQNRNHTLYTLSWFYNVYNVLIINETWMMYCKWEYIELNYCLKSWSHPQFALTGSPRSPIPGSPGSPLGPGIPCRATELPMSAGSTGHTSQGSPWRPNRSQTHNADEKGERADWGELLLGFYTFSPLCPAGPLGPCANNNRTTESQWHITISGHCSTVWRELRHTSLNNNRYLNVSHWISRQSILALTSGIPLLHTTAHVKYYYN